MSAYAAAYAPPPPGGYGRAAGPASRAPPAATCPRAPLEPDGFEHPSAGSGAPGAGPDEWGQAFGGGGPSGGLLYAGGGWPSAEQLVAAVPVRPYEFARPPESVAVGARSGVAQSRGSVAKPFATGEEAEFLLLRGLLTDTEVAEILASGCKVLSGLIGAGRAREEDPADGRPRFAVDLVDRGVYGGDLAHVLRPLVEGALLPFLRARRGLPGLALATARFRRFLPEERRFVPPGHEHGAVAVATIGLQDPAAFTGGLFVQGSGRAFLDRRFVQLGRGDALVYGHDLHHGVEVQEGSRFELRLLFKDSQAAVATDSSPWYRRAAELGDPAAQYGLALSLFGQRDYTGALAWLERACAQDYPEALHTKAEWTWEPPAGLGIEVETAGSLQLLRRAAELGHGPSQARLGELLIQGVKGRVQQDSWEGKRLLRMAFEQDSPDAAFHLGHALLNEGDRDGVTKLLAASAKGHPRACFQVAEMYREGQYQMPKDPQQSLRYTKWAAHQGDPQAMSNLGHLLINGVGVVRDDAKAVRLFRQSAKLGAAEGMLNYGLALLRGNGGVRVDYQEALQWAQKSAALGHNLAQQQLPTFFNAARSPNPPARSLPRSREEVSRLSVKELGGLLRTEGIDFSDCVEKADLVARAAMHLLGGEEPWDAAPEHALTVEPPKMTKDELMRLRQLRQSTVSPAPQGAAPVAGGQPIFEDVEDEVFLDTVAPAPKAAPAAHAAPWSPAAAAFDDADAEVLSAPPAGWRRPAGGGQADAKASAPAGPPATPPKAVRAAPPAAAEFEAID